MKRINKLLILLLPIPFNIFSLNFYNQFFGLRWGGEEDLIWPKLFLPFPIKYCNSSYFERLCELNTTGIFLDILYWIIIFTVYILFIKRFKYNFIYALISTALISMLPFIWMILNVYIFV